MAIFMLSKMLRKLFSSIFLLITFSVAEHTLFPNQTLLPGQTLVSQNQVFEMGFFSPGNSSNRFLGTWYKSTPDVVFWVANRNNPINDIQKVTLAISGNGNIVINRGGSIIWSSNPSGPASDPVLQLLNTGNLVVVEKTTTKQSYLWQSFDDPTDNWLPGMELVDDGVDAGTQRYLTSWKSSGDPSPGDYFYKIDNQGLPDMTIYREDTKEVRAGKWNGIGFGGLPSFPTNLFETDLVFREERLVSMSRPYNSSSILTRLQLTESGFLVWYAMSTSGHDSWSVYSLFPKDQCDRYGSCGPNAICRIDKAPVCQCFRGFSPKNRNDWNLLDWSGGCTRILEISCEGGDRFAEVRGVKYPDMLRYWLNTTMSLEECKAECSRNCICTAYANPYVTNGGSGCVMWLGDLIDITEIPQANSKQNIYIRLQISELGTTANTEKTKKSKRRLVKLVAILVASGVSLSGLIGGGILLAMRRQRRESKVNWDDVELPMFKLATISSATKDFSRENLIGEGGFGRVYKGNLSADEEIAVKRLSLTSKQGLKEFKNEVILIAKLQHRNLVKLLGCCIEGEERILIYEYLHNKSLDYFVFDQDQRKLLTWPKRFEIVMGIARGLLYLHQDSRLKIIHRDLKTSNILLDGDFNPKISDFGLARIFGEGQSTAKTKRVVGTYGYMAPEYAIDGKFSVKSDIFALGVMLLEIVSGKKNRGFDHYDHYHNLLGHAWLLWKEDRILELMDECLSSTFEECQVRRCVQVGLLCVQKFAEARPAMPSVLSMLGTEGEILPKPKEPGFFVERSSSCIVSAYQQTLTITELEAR